MTEDDKDTSVPGLEEQVRDMLRRMNMAFVTPAAGVRGGAAAPREDPPKPETAPPEDRLKSIREFTLKPRDVRDYLDRFVIRQDEAKQVLSVAICDHYNHCRRAIEHPESSDEEYAKHNVILLGPTGVGKTYLARCIAKLVKVPFVKADATKFSETGYVGHDVEDLVRDLVKAADDDVELAQYGIIYLDEIDKIAAQPSAGGKDVSGRGVQVNLLKLMEETETSLFSQTDLLGQMQAVMDMQKGRAPGKRTINTRHILFIVSGAFDKLADQVRRRVQSSTIGFRSSDPRMASDADFLRAAQTRDLVDYGFEPEFVGRLPVRVVCDALGERDLEEIMNRSEGSILSQYRHDFEGYGIGFRVTPEAVRAIARKAHAEGTGARGLMTVMERVLRGYKFELPSSAVRHFELDGDMVERPAERLADVLATGDTARSEAMRGDLRAFAEAFLQEHGLKLVFTRDGIERVVDLCAKDGRPVGEFCRDRFRDLQFGLSLISRNTGQTTFQVTARFVDDPPAELSRRVAKSFKGEPD